MDIGRKNFTQFRFPTMSKTHSYNETLCFAAAAFTSKLMINKILIARARFATQTPSWSEDSAEKLGIMAPIFKVLLAAVGPLTSKDDLARLPGLERNSSECEPAFLLAAAAYGFMITSPPAYAANLILAGVTSRYLHSLFFVFIPAQPYRAISFLFPTAVTLFFSAQVISKYRST